MNDNDVVTVRLADLAICLDRMWIELHQLVWQIGYSHLNSHPGAAGELMLVSMQTAIATRDEQPMTISEITKALRMPYSNVKRQLDVLMSDGRVTRVKHRYVHDLDRLDELMSSLAALDQAIGTVERCSNEWKRLRPLLLDRLK